MPPKLPSPDPQNHEIPDFVWIDRISRLMDSRFTIPGTSWRFGIDPVIGLLPFAGDAASLMVSGTLVMYMARHGASRKLIILMLGNILIDAIFGSIPILGNIFDIYYKANNRNVRLMKRYYTEGKYQGKGTGILVLAGLFLLLLMAGLIYGMIKVADLVAGWINRADFI